MKTIRDKYTEETGNHDYDYFDGWETHYHRDYGGWLESKIIELESKIDYLKEMNLHLNTRIKFWRHESKITEHKLRELKNPKNPE